MNILAFDTCFDACSVAVRKAGSGEIITRRKLIRRGHAEALLPMIEQAMQAAGLKFDELERIAATHGPGTFTGARVGMSAALGFALAHKLPVVTYSSLQLVARAAIAALSSEQLAELDGILVARDAKRDSVYLEMTDTKGAVLAPPALLSISAARDWIADRRLFGLGSGVGLLLSGHTDVRPSDVVTWELEPPPGIDEPDARYMLEDAQSRAPIEHPRPLYLRPPDAMPSSRPPLARA
jgi:tRNA threonylcarbamoyladenosine biosynthesis protein TsaB